jgi:peptide/nickel transport system substrate-binding protein
MMVIAGCSSSDETSTTEGEQPTQNDASSSGPVSGGTLKIIMTQNPVNMGFPATGSAQTQYYYFPALEGLGRYDEKGNIQPHLAESWETNPDEATITIKLREGIKFHDGTDFDAEAVKWNIEQFQKANRAEVAGLKSIEVVDPHTLKLSLEKWDYSFLESLAYYVLMVSPTAVEKNGVEWAEANPVGTGPFKFESWERDVSVKFTKNEAYWVEGKPYLDGIEYQLVYDINTAENQFRSGGAHVLTEVTPLTSIEFGSSGEYKMNRLASGFGASGVGLMFPSANENDPLSDVNVRKAVIHAVDRKTIVESVVHGVGIPLNQWYTPDTPYYNPDVDGLAYDPEKAKQLLAEAGYPNGVKVAIHTANYRLDEMTAVQNYLAEVGIEAEINLTDGARIAEMTRDKWEGMTMYHYPISPNPVADINRHFNPNAAFFSKNIIHPERMLELLAEARAAREKEEMISAIHELQKVMFDENAMFLPIYATNRAVFMTKDVQDLNMGTTYYLDWAPEDAWLSQ